MFRTTNCEKFVMVFHPCFYEQKNKFSSFQMDWTSYFILLSFFWIVIYLEGSCYKTTFVFASCTILQVTWTPCIHQLCWKLVQFYNHYLILVLSINNVKIYNLLIFFGLKTYHVPNFVRVFSWLGLKHWNLLPSW
jgi:hypothetical protein